MDLIVILVESVSIILKKIVAESHKNFVDFTTGDHFKPEPTSHVWPVINGISLTNKDRSTLKSNGWLTYHHLTAAQYFYSNNIQINQCFNLLLCSPHKLLILMEVMNLKVLRNVFQVLFTVRQFR